MASLPGGGRLASIPGRGLVGSRWTSDPDERVQAFEAWTQRFLSASPGDRAALVAEGTALARQRREILANWIRSDPERALAAAIPVRIRRGLPDELQPLLEERVSGAGDLALIGAVPMPGGPPVPPLFRKALVAGREFDAYTYGRRRRHASLTNVSIFGIAIDGALAVNDSPVRLLEPGETADGKPVSGSCPVSGKASPPPANGFNRNPAAPNALEVNGAVEVFCEPIHLADRELALIRAETGTEQILGNNLPGTSGVAGRPVPEWTHGSKRLLVIRIDFPDKQGTPLNPYDGDAQITETYVVDAINGPGGVRDFYEANSFGKTTIQIAPAVAGDSPDVTPVLRMPRNASYYAAANLASTLHSDARSAAVSAGFDLDDYDRIGVVFADLSELSNSKFNFGGLGSIESKNFWVNGWWSFQLVAHEIGHNYGLHHANLWKVPDTSPVSAAGTSEEYGDDFDIMGGGESSANHFSHWNKSLLQWIPDVATRTANQSGTYRLHRFDHASSSPGGNALALKIVRNGDQDYWIGYRRATPNASLDAGAYVLWGYNENRGGDLLDLTLPLNDVTSAGLPLHTTFSDAPNGIAFRPVAQGGSGNADEWLDVAVTLQPRLSWQQSAFFADEQSGAVTLTVRRENSADGLITVDYTTANGTATAPADYAAQTGTLTWPNGDLEPKTITIPVVADSLIEESQTFTVTLSSPSGGAVLAAPAAATVTIIGAGTRDPSFAPSFINSSVEKVLALPDGDIIAVGWFSLVGDAVVRSGLARFNADGSFDPAFGDGPGTGGFDNPVYTVARQPDGKLIVGGKFTQMHGVPRNRIARLEADGSLDLGFNPGTGTDNIVESILIQPDGRILIGGSFTSCNGIARERLARLNPDGSLDLTFIGPDFQDGPSWRVSSLARQPDGRVLVGGAFYLSTSAPFQSGLCRLLANGTLDTSFNGVNNGAHDLGSPGDLRRVRDIELQIDGKILVAGDFTAFNAVSRGGLARLNANGSLDTSFSTSSNGSCFTVLQQPDGKILAGGSFTTFNGVAASRLVRLGQDGTVDGGFTAAGGPNDSVNSLALQADGKVIFGADRASYQNAPLESPLWRFFAGLPALPGTIQFATGSITAFEGSNATVQVTRVGGSNGALIAGYSTVPGTATADDFTATSGTLSWAAGDSAPKTLQIPLTADNSLETGETFFVHLGEPLLNGTLLGTTQRLAVTAADPPSFDTWRQAAFPGSEALDASVSGPEADPDSDGWNNVQEYAFALDPKSPDPDPPFLSHLLPVGGAHYLALTFRRRIAHLDLQFKVQTNSGLSTTWVDGAALPVGSAIDNGDGTETVTYRDIQSVETAPRRFLRLRIDLAP
jgi:uncharacterized delta-60 repeat protein